MNRLNTNNSGKATRGRLRREKVQVHTVAWAVDGVLALMTGTTKNLSKLALPLGGGEVEGSRKEDT